MNHRLPVSPSYQKLMDSRYKKMHPAYRWVYDCVRDNSSNRVEYGYVNLRKDGAISFRKTSNLRFVFMDVIENALPYPLLLGGRIVSLSAPHLESLWNLKPSPAMGSPRLSLSINAVVDNSTNVTMVSGTRVTSGVAEEVSYFWELENSNFIPCLRMNDLGMKFYSSRRKPDLGQFLRDHRGAVSSRKFDI